MGLILDKWVDDDCRLGIWKITESYDELLSDLSLTASELETVQTFKNYQRKLEWLSVRVLINRLLQKSCQIIYNQDHKPFLSCNFYNISISHSHQLTSVLLSSKYRVGIDLEYMSHQIHKVAHKFINDKEKITNNRKLERLHLYIHWCAKEALYKICDKQDINFRHNLTILPFSVQNQGTLIGHLNNRLGHKEFELHYFTYDQYVIVWCKN